MKKTVWMTMLAISLLATGAQAAELHVQGAWVRLPPPVSDTAAAYALFGNPGKQDVRITGVSADVAASAMLHSMAGGRMETLKHADVPAGGRVRFAPGGMHIMLMGLKHPLTAGDTIRIDLRYADGSHQGFDAVVRDARSDAGGMEHMGDMHDMGGMEHPH
ncbi:MAG TPA: copper chaperone PCu(A)C [Mariprofundaceae bacterium]|nr:copper chaperone PCu(A)C [Mariprofundaceae bacterium]